MSDALYELIFWIVVFIAFFFGFRWLQKRGREDSPPDAQQRESQHRNRD